MSKLEPVLKDKYEVIVIGSGIGGLSTAAILAKNGLQVLVCEQGYCPGGCCSSVKVRDFTFDTAASIIHGFGRYGFNVMKTVFDHLGQQIDLMPRDSALTIVFGNWMVDFYRDEDSFTTELGALFPRHAGALLRYMRDLEDLYDAILDCGGPLAPKTDEPIQKHGILSKVVGSPAKVMRAQKISAAEMLREHVDDPEVLAFFNADSSFSLGYTMDQVSASTYALLAIERFVAGTHHAIGSAQQVANHLEKSIHDNAGRVLFHTMVDSILTEDGRALGVRLSGGRELRSRVVIADTSEKNLYDRLLRETLVDPLIRERISRLEPAGGVMAIYLSIPESIVPEDFNPSTVVIVDPVNQPDAYISISIPSMFDPNLSPEGHHSVTVLAATDPSAWPHPGDPGYRSEDYQVTKRVAAAKVLEKLDVVLPGISEESEIHGIASPSTFERAIMREGGSPAALKEPGSIFPADAPGVITPIEGLFLVGDSTYFGKGVASATASGLQAASAVFNHLDIEEPDVHDNPTSLVLETVPRRPIISGGNVVDALSAILEAQRCMRCEDAPCIAVCPAGTDLPNVMRRVGTGDFSGASRLLREANALGEFCGTLCPAGSLCEKACCRAAEGSPIRISQLESFLCGYMSGAEGWPVPYGDERREKVAIVGAGPAGLSCAFYLSNMGYSVVLFDEAPEAGGAAADALRGKDAGDGVVHREIEGILASGIDFRGNTSLGKGLTFDKLSEEGFSAVFIATGKNTINLPDIPGTDLPGVLTAKSFLSSTRRDVAVELASSVLVSGDDAVAIETATLARDLGTDTVYLVAGEEFAPGSELLEQFEAASASGITVLTGRKIARISGEGRVESVTLAISDDAADHPESTANRINVGTVIIASGRELDATLTDYLAEFIELNEDGTIKVDPNTLECGTPGIFAGGDVTGPGGGLVARACGEGRRAALSIDRHLCAKRASSPDDTETDPAGSPD